MKKKLFALLTFAALAAALVTGCGGGGSSEPAPEEPSVVESITVAEESLPPLEEDLKQLYADAYKIYNQISFGIFDYDEETTMEKDGFTYYKITDSRFETYDDFQKFLEQYFTTEFVTTGILSESNIMFAKGEDGALYFLGSGRAANPLYAGHTFAMDKESDAEIGFKATAYYTNNGSIYEGEPFYTAPENPEEYTTQEYLFVLWNEDGVWKFDNFTLFF